MPPEHSADYLLVFTRRRFAIFDDQGGKIGGASPLEGPWAEAEEDYQTLLAALRLLWRRLGPQVNHSVLVVRGDRALVLDHLAGQREPEDDAQRRLRDEARQLLGDFKRWRCVLQSPDDTRAILGEP
jgi:hypothetical protein